MVISNDTFALVGNSALLACVGFGVPSVEFTWSLNGASIMNSSIVTISEEEFTRGEIVFKQSFLELCSLSISDSGVYTCSVSNGLTMVNDTTQLSVVGNFNNLHSLMIRPKPHFATGLQFIPITHFFFNGEGRISSQSAILFYFPTVPDESVSELVVISNDTFALVGNSALLACVGFGVPSVEITWSLNGTSIMNSSIVTISEEEFTRGEMVFKQSFLELCSLSISDSGVYTCSVSNGLTMVNDTTQLSVVGNFNNLHSFLMIRPESHFVTGLQFISITHFFLMVREGYYPGQPYCFIFQQFPSVNWWSFLMTLLLWWGILSYWLVLDLEYQVWRSLGA